ncbi:MAG: hypothetical protein ACREOW_00745 [Thermodesulfobacteriota bacterium]
MRNKYKADSTNIHNCHCERQKGAKQSIALERDCFVTEFTPDRSRGAPRSDLRFSDMS